jgi:hypothetical protein
MVSSSGVATKTGSPLNQIVTALGEVTGKSSPQAMAVLGKLKAKYGFSISRNDITKTKKGSFCSVNLLADLIEHKTKQ